MDVYEFIFLAAFIFIGGRWTFNAARRILAINAIARRREPRATYLALFASCLAALWIALLTVAAHEVRTDLGLQVLFVAGGMTAIAVATEVTAILGLDAIGDGIERNNLSARFATGGVWIATTLCAIGANIGEGDFVGTTFAPLAMALVGLLLVCAAYSAATRGFAVIAVERDCSAGLRFAGLVIAASLPLAKAASGDWVSWIATVRDFVRALPALGALLCIALVVERRVPSASAEMPPRSMRRGIAVALGYVAVAGGAVLLQR